MIEFVGKFDENAAGSALKRQIKKLWWMYLGFSLLFIVIGIFGIVLPGDNSDIVFGVVMLVFGVLFTPICLLLTKLLQKNYNKSMHVLSPDTVETYQFFPDRLIITQRKGEEYEATTTAKYSYLYKVEETGTHYFMKISKAQMHVVKKSDLTQGTIGELNGILASNLGTKFKPAK